MPLIKSPKPIWRASLGLIGDFINGIDPMRTWSRALTHVGGGETCFEPRRPLCRLQGMGQYGHLAPEVFAMSRAIRTWVLTALAALTIAIIGATAPASASWNNGWTNGLTSSTADTSQTGSQGVRVTGIELPR
jgi:hypothetical protein